MNKLSLKQHFENGQLESLPKLAQESANYNYSICHKFTDAINAKNTRIANCSGWFSDSISKEELNTIKSPTNDQIYDYIEENEINLIHFDKKSRNIIRDYSAEVLTQILKNDKCQ